MSSTDILSMLALLLGGLTFFLFGMSVMSGGLEQMAGGGLERTLKKVGKNDFLGFSLGAGITVAIQSSSAMTVMLVGLVNSGILAFSDTFGMIMGSHVGTTLTAWILTLNANTGNNFFMMLLKPMIFAPILAFAGIAMRMFSKNTKKQKLGDIFIGFAVLMVGMNMMSESMADVKKYSDFLILFSNSPIIAFLVSTAFTGIIQSSAATVAIVQAIALSVGMDYAAAIPLVIGANIGTCMTAIVSSIGTNKNAKRVVAMHVYTNAIGGIGCMILLYIVMAFSPDILKYPISIFGVAIVHSLFNILNTVAFVPFKKPMLRLCEKTVSKSNEKEHTVFLDERLFYNTPLAISECKRLATEMAEITRTSVLEAISLLNKFDDGLSEKIEADESIVDKYEDRLGTYLVKLSGNSLIEKDSHYVARLLHSIGDLERISDHALNIRDLALELKEKQIVFSEEAGKEIDNVSSAVEEIVNITIDSFILDDGEKASHVEPLEQVIDKLNAKLKSAHIDRLQRGECTTKLGFIFSDLLTDYERISDHCSNLAVFTMQLDSEKLDAHSYLNSLKTMDNPKFAADYNMYGQKYLA